MRNTKRKDCKKGEETIWAWYGREMGNTDEGQVQGGAVLVLTHQKFFSQWI